MTEVVQLLHGEENVERADAGYIRVTRPEHEGRQMIREVAARQVSLLRYAGRMFVLARFRSEKAMSRNPPRRATAGSERTQRSFMGKRFTEYARFSSSEL